ncbi:histamine H1 receptor [Elgaria multicarinata webbii]|uniref:histamine H1 receptor n=1 Tax=Elgaria multicarinata webbii TaxID=159646 RepID=UPI002FCD52C6
MCVPDRTTNKNSTVVQPVLGLTLGSISFVTVVMNLLVLYAVKTEKKLQTVGNLYIVSLSCADVIVGAAVMPLNIVYLLHDKWILTRNACLFWLSMDYVASTASIFSLFILCIDRYRSVQQPLQYLKYRTKTRASIMISVAWLLSFMWVIPILGWRNFTNLSSTTINNGTDDENICETDFCRTTWFKVLTAMINFYVPSLLMLWFYLQIYKAVRRHCRHRELIKGSFRSASGKTDVHIGTLQEMQNICSQNASKYIGYVPNKNDNFDQNKRTEVRHLSSNFDKIPRSFLRGRDHKVGKLSCFPLAIVQNNIEIVSTERKYTCASESIQNAEGPCPQDDEFSKTSEQQTFAEKLSTGHDSDPTLEQNSYTEGCFPQYTSRKDPASLRYLKKTWGRLRTYSISQNQSLHVNRDRKAAKQLGIIMAAFMLCWIPYFVLFMVMAFCESCYNRPVHMFTIWLGYVNSTLNPFIYPFCNENFKKAFKNIFHIKS